MASRSRLPPLREIPLGDNPDVTAFAEQLMAGEFDVVIFETGVGVRYLAEAIETRLPREMWIEALSRAQVVGGVQPGDGLRELNARVDLHVPMPDTWHETLALLDSQLPVAGLRIAVQEYGKPNIDSSKAWSDAGQPSPASRSTDGPCPRTLGRFTSGHCRDRSGTSRHRNLHGGPASRASAPGRLG